MTRARLASAAIALVLLQLKPVMGSSLQDDPVTICSYYDLGDKNFPGRGTEIEDNDNCVVIKNGRSTKPVAVEQPVMAHYNDSINYQWSEGQPSATEKYATAFGLDVKTLMDSVSISSGVDSMNYSIVCTSDSDCDTPWEHCGIRAEASSGYIDAAYGLSHAWAPASVLEKKPKCPVTFSGVTFEPLDIKALLMRIYDTATVFTGVRYSGGNFSVDNHEAAQTFYRLQTYPWNEAAKSIVHVKSSLSWSNATFAGRRSEVDEQTGTGADYEYLLEMDDVDQIIGGEWLNKSNDEHPDFLWFPERKPALDTVTDTGLSYANVVMLLEKSAACAN
ncbi:hypothetical protein PInf_022958 [Phytophthora infestans]|nr:hypothetical protein PInf_022958 [Phytophthora infestans]